MNDSCAHCGKTLFFGVKAECQGREFCSESCLSDWEVQQQKIEEVMEKSIEQVCKETSQTLAASRSALDAQVGGNHYKDMKIQPVDYILENGIGYLEGNVIKYISRHKSKNGKQDIEKAIHYCQMILEKEYK